jgi:pyrroloquinoline-quinone synthase
MIDNNSVESPSSCNNEVRDRFLRTEWIERLMSVDFLKRCEAGDISWDKMKLFLIQHQLYAKHFTRYLSALISNIEDNEERFKLSQNLFDEMGLGDAGNIPHSVIYSNMMKNLGIDTCDDILPETQALIDTMMNCCRSTNVMVGLGAICLGAEGIVPVMYSAILKGLLANNIQINDLSFFSLHISCDDEHAGTMYKIIDRMVNVDGYSIEDLNRGAETIISARINFFNALI